ncbi:MAG: cache domain-containing protein, partial [Thermodesulfobacteriota bacterium]
MSIRQIGIRGKLVVLLLALSIVPLIIVSVLSYNNGKKMLAESIGAQLHEIAHSVMDNMDSLIDVRSKDVQAWAKGDIMQDIMTDDSDGRIASFLIDVKQSYGGIYSDIYVLNSKGEIIASSSPNPSILDIVLVNEGWFSRAMAGELAVEDVHRSDLTGGLAIGLSLPVRASFDETKIIGVLSARIDWERIANQVSNMPIHEKPQTKYVHMEIINKEGLALVNPAYEKKDEILNANLITAGMESAKLASQGGKGWFVEPMEHGEFMGLIGYAASEGAGDFKGLGWSVLVEKSLKDAYAPIGTFQKQILLFGLLVAAVIAALSYIVARSIAGPILTLTNTAIIIAQGDLTQTVDVKSKDETGRLGTAFNGLIGNLRNLMVQVRDAGLQLT